MPKVVRINHAGGIAGSSGAQQTAGVVTVGAQGAFLGRNNQDFCEVCRAYGHLPQMFPILQKYSNIPNNTYYELCASTMHHTDQCRALDSLAERLDRSMFRVNESKWGDEEEMGEG